MFRTKFTKRHRNRYWHSIEPETYQELKNVLREVKYISEEVDEGYRGDYTGISTCKDLAHELDRLAKKILIVSSKLDEIEEDENELLNDYSD